MTSFAMVCARKLKRQCCLHEDSGKGWYKAPSCYRKGHVPLCFLPLSFSIVPMCMCMS
jgi:hypothetical protein